jgi:hypothetical protein
MADVTNVTTKPHTGRSLIEKGARATPREIGSTPAPGEPVTQLLPLFTGGMLVAAEIHDLPNPNDLEKPTPGYKMWSTATGYVWVPKAEADSIFSPADEANPLVQEQALKQGLRIVLPPAPPLETTTTTTPAPGTMGSSRR